MIVYKLQSFNICNPLSYRDGMTMTWQNGRQLSTLQTENNSVSYKYNSNGLRTQKTDNSGTTDYYYDSNNNLIGLTKSNRTLFFYYDTEGSPTSFSYNGEMYYYIKNLQGDIVKVINQAGVTYANYVYDAFGNILEAYGDPIISKLSPFRYRGYVYDIETGLYYLQSRYYDPVTGRFLNADVYCDTGNSVLSTNMFTYCENNSIKYTDKTGTVTPANVIGAIIGGIIGAVGGYFLTNWLADKLKLKGWSRNLFVWGLTALIGAAAAAIGYFIGPYVAKAWSTWCRKLSTLVKQSVQKIANISAQKMSHINVSKHLWSKVMKKVTTKEIQKIIKKGIHKGSWQLLKNGSIKIIYKYKGQIIVITGKVINKVFQIGDAWVWNGKGSP